jgi:tetratricopeptide (TPR) repeat protein
MLSCRMATPKGPKKLSSPVSTSGEGGHFESRVQASYLLALLSGDDSRFLAHSQLIELRFQGRIHGFNTDDLICTVERDDGSTFKVAMQVKLTLKARVSDTPFKDSITDAWHDYDAGTQFKRDVDSRDSGTGTVHAASKVCAKARAAANSADFVKAALSEGYSSSDQRDALSAIRKVVEQETGTPLSDDDLYGFCRHLWFLEHRLATDDSADAKHHIKEIGWTLGKRHGGPANVWNTLVTVCERLNEQAATVTRLTVRNQLDSAQLVADFDRHRASQAGGEVVEIQPVVAAAERKPLDDTFAFKAAVGAASTPLMDSAALGEARQDSANRWATKELEGVNDLIKAFRYQEAQARLAGLEAYLAEFDDYQKSRWYLLQATCNWHRGATADAARDFLKAAEAFPDDERNAAAKIRGLLLSDKLAQALEAGRIARERFPESIFVWAANANAEIIGGLVPDESTIPEAHRNSADALQLIAAGLHKAGRLQEAADVSLRSLTADKPGFYVRAAALAHVLDLVAQNNVHAALRVLTAEHKRMLKAVSDSLEPRAERVWAIQADEAVSVVASNLAAVYLLQGNPGEALEVAKEARVNQRSRSELIRVELEALHDTGQVEAMFALGVENLSYLQDGGLVALAQVAANRGEVRVAQQIFERTLPRDDIESDVKEALRATKWLAMWNAKQRAEVAQELQGLVVEETSSITLLAAAARLARPSDKRKSEAALLRVRQLAGKKPPAEVRLLLADLYSDLKDFKRAAKFYESVLPSEGAGDLHARLLHSLLRSGDRRKAKEVLERLPDGWVNNDELRSLATEIARDAGDWPLLTRLADAQFARKPDDIGSWLFKYMVGSRELPAAELKEFIGRAPLGLTGSIQQVSQLAFLELRLGLKGKAVQRLYQMRRLQVGKIESASALMMAYLAYNEPIADLHAVPNVVGPGVHVALEGPAGVTHLTVDPRELAGLPEDAEFKSAADAAVQPFLGRAAGHEVRVDTGFGGPRVYRVLSLDSAYARQLVLAQSQVESSVEPVPNLWMVQVRKEPDSEPDFSEVHETLKRQSQRIREALKSYQELPFTLGGLGRLMGNNAVDIVKGWTTGLDDGPLHVSDGNAEELERARAVLADRDNAYLIDAPTLTEMVLLDATDALAALGEVYATTETEGVLRLKLEEIREKGPEGRLLDDNGQMRFVEVTEQAREHARRQAQAAIDALQRYCKVVPAYGPEHRPKFLSRVERILSPEELSVLDAALERTLCLVTTDLRLRHIADQVQVRGVWPQVLLQHAAEQGVMTRQRYSLSALRLLLSNRSFVPLTPEDLWVLFQQSTPWMRFGVARLKVYLAKPTVHFESTYGIVKSFVALAAMRGTRVMALAEVVRHLMEGVMRHKDATPETLREMLEVFESVLESHWQPPYPPVVRHQGAVVEAQFRFLAEAAQQGAMWAQKPAEDRQVRLLTHFVTKTPVLLYEMPKESDAAGAEAS